MKLPIFLPFTSLREKFFKILLISTLTTFVGVSTLNGQILKDSSAVNLLKKGIDCIYNFDFKDAESINLELGKLYPGHAITFLFSGMMTYWQNYPLLPTSGASDSFVTDMRKSIDLCEKDKSHENEAEVLLLNLCARGFLLLYYTENNLSFEVFPIASSTYQCIRRSFEFTSISRDLFFFTGIYNYYREAYPEAHPVYKALAFLFPRGSKEKGLIDLQNVAKNSVLMKAEAYTFLNDIYLSFENDFEKATYYSGNLHKLYPENPEYISEYIKNLLLVKKYDEAEKVMLSSRNIKNDFFQSQLAIYTGILQEKKYHNIVQAEQSYNKGIKDISGFRDKGYSCASYGYFGLSRIAAIKGDSQNEKYYRKLALKISDFKNINFDD